MLGSREEHFHNTISIHVELLNTFILTLMMLDDQDNEPQNMTNR
jgi:hypothetical protein